MSDFKLTYFKLTYASMFNPPEEVHERFEASLADVKANQLGKTHAMLINNKDVFAESTYENRSPINHNWLLARLQAGTSQHADSAIAAARKNRLVQYPQTCSILKRIEENLRPPLPPADGDPATRETSNRSSNFTLGSERVLSEFRHHLGTEVPFLIC